MDKIYQYLRSSKENLQYIYSQNQLQRLCIIITSNTGFNRLVNTSTDANGDSHICADCNQRFHTNRSLNQHVRSCYLKNKNPDFQTPYERNTGNETIKHQKIQILRLVTVQLHHCDINGANIKIICLREIYLPLTKKQYTGRKIYCFYHRASRKEFHR